MTVTTASGTKIYIGTTMTIPGLSPSIEYDDDTYVEIGEVENLGEFGDESNTVTFAAIGDARVRNLKGARNAGVLALVVGRDPDDAGQDALIAAEQTNDEYNFKVEHSDADAGGTPTISYFRALVMSRRETVGENDNVVRRTFNLGINTAITEIPKAP